jgi:hypothetical protein
VAESLTSADYVKKWSLIGLACGRLLLYSFAAFNLLAKFGKKIKIIKNDTKK